MPSVIWLTAISKILNILQSRCNLLMNQSFRNTFLLELYFIHLNHILSICHRYLRNNCVILFTFMCNSQQGIKICLLINNINYTRNLFEQYKYNFIIQLWHWLNYLIQKVEKFLRSRNTYVILEMSKISEIL